MTPAPLLSGYYLFWLTPGWLLINQHDIVGNSDPPADQGVVALWIPFRSGLAGVVDRHPSLGATR